MADRWTREGWVFEAPIDGAGPRPTFNEKPAQRELVPLLLSTVVITLAGEFAIHARLCGDDVVGFCLEEAEVRLPLDRFARYRAVLDGSGRATRRDERDQQDQ